MVRACGVCSPLAGSLIEDDNNLSFNIYISEVSLNLLTSLGCTVYLVCCENAACEVCLFFSFFPADECRPIRCVGN